MAAAIPVGSGNVGELYAELAGRLQRIVRREVRAPAALIDDACQFAWWRLVVHANRVERRGALSWLAKTAVHEARKLSRRAERDLSLEEPPAGAGEAAISGLRPELDQIAEQRAKLELLCALPARQRTVLLLQAAGFSYEETAGSLGLSRRTVERQIMRGRRRLRAAAHAQEVNPWQRGRNTGSAGSVGHGGHRRARPSMTAPADSDSRTDRGAPLAGS